MGKYRIQLMLILVASFLALSLAQFEAQARLSEIEVDVVFMKQTGMNEVNIFVTDVDSPEIELIQITDFTGLESYLETDTSEEAYENYAALTQPAYMGIWVLDYEAENDVYLFKNLETEASIPMIDCAGTCQAYRISPDGRWLVLERDSQHLSLIDLSQFEEAEEVYLFDGYVSHVFWLSESEFLFWHPETRRYFVYETSSQSLYPFESVFDKQKLLVDTTNAEAVNLPIVSEIATESPQEIILPPEFSEDWAYDWSNDNRKLLYVGSDYISAVAQFCDGCAVNLWDSENQSLEILMSFEGGEGGFRVTNILWSPDNSRFIASVGEIGVYHQGDIFWLYEMETGDYHEVFSGMRAQWLH